MKKKRSAISILINSILIIFVSLIILSSSVVIHNLENSKQEKSVTEQSAINNEMPLSNFNLNGNYIEDDDDFGNIIFLGGGGSSSRSNSNSDTDSSLPDSDLSESDGLDNSEDSTGDSDSSMDNEADLDNDNNANENNDESEDSETETNPSDNSDFIDNEADVDDGDSQSSDDKKSMIEDENEDFIDVIVMLKDDALTITSDRLLGIKSIVKTKQEKVLSNLDTDEFYLKYRYNTISGFAGKITQKGLTKLEQDPNVEAIYEDKMLHITLEESVPLINADDVWDLGITGQDSVVCVVDTGIDYTHPDLGNPSCTITETINGNIEDYSLESPHFYDNNYDNTSTITKPGFSQIAVHFSTIDVEYYFDKVHIKDANDNIVQSFTGYHEDVWSVSVPGDTIKVNLVTDSSVTRWGFAIDKVLDGTVDYTWNNCGRFLGGYDFYNNDNDPMDDNSHGTHVAGIVAANGGLKGVAPDAELVAVKVCSAGGGCSGSAMIAGVDWCNAHSSEYNIVATTMSIGDSGRYNSATCPTWMDEVIDTAHDLGIAVTVASGNNYYSTGISYPACSPNAISVGSTTKADVISYFTNTGELLDLLAPGSNIYSTVLGGNYGYKSGTSMATPHVAGAIALLKQSSPLALPDQMRDALKRTGIPIVDPYSGLSFPRIDVLATINIECSSKSDCGTEDYVGSPVCQNDDVWQDYKTYECDLYCSDSTAFQLKEECEHGCTEGRCLIEICNWIGCYYV